MQHIGLLKSVSPAWLVAAGLAVLGCGNHPDAVPRNLTAPIALDADLVWFDSSRDEALLLPVGDKEPQPRLQTVGLGGQPRAFLRRNGHDEALVLLADRDADTGDLVVLRKNGVRARYPLGAQFDTLIQSDEGDFAIARYLPEVASTSDSFLFNPNEIAIVDLSGNGSSAVTQKTIRSPGSAPSAILVAPPMDVAGELRKLAVILFDTQVALVDLNHPERPEYTIELTRSASVRLRQVRFSVEERKIYVLADGSADVYVLNLAEAGDNRANDYEPSLNQLGADATPKDMTVFESDGGTRLLVASGSSAQIVEASSSRVTQIPLSSAANSILPFTGRSPFDDAEEQRALLFSIGSSVVTFLDLRDAEARTTRNLEQVAIPGGVQALVKLNGNKVLIPQSSGGMTILDLDGRTASPIQARLNLTAIVPSLGTQTLWAVAQGSNRLGFIDLTDLHPGQVELNKPVQQLFVFEESKRVVALHTAAEGAVTILNANSPDAAEGMLLQGFLAEGALDR